MAAAYPKITDNEMNYFQFKAKQLCELMKEDEAWVKHCALITNESCDECSTKKPDAQTSKTIGIQVTPRKPLNTLGRPALQTKSPKEETLNDLKNRLENIELELGKIYETAFQNEKKKISEGDPSIIKAPAFLSTSKLLEEQKKSFIQDSLKASIAKIDHLSPGKLKKSGRTIKNVNSGYFLPHELQKKRAVSRKAYLASLEMSNVKQQAIPENYNQGTSIAQRNTAKKVFHKTVSKTSKTINAKTTKPVKSNAVEDETLVKSTEDDEIKDKNIEYVVDGILDDLLREAVLDLNRIELTGSIFQLLRTADQQADPGGDKEKPSNSSVENTVPKEPFTVDATQLTTLKSFLDSVGKLQVEMKKASEECVNSSITPISPEKSKQIHDEFLKTGHKIVFPPKFVCSVSHIISIDAIKAKEISVQKEEFWKYLSRISRTVKGNFNPWAFCNAISDSIVDDCIEDIAEELCKVPSALIKFLYNQEFLQQVE